MNPHQPENCAQVRAVIPLLAGDDLEPVALEAARRHTALCGPCAQALEAAREARSALGQLRVERAAPDVWGPLRETLRAEGLIRGPILNQPVALASDPRAAGPARRRTRAFNSAAAALFGALFLGALLTDRSTPPLGPSESGASLVSSPERSVGAPTLLGAAQVEAPAPSSDPLTSGRDLRLVGGVPSQPRRSEPGEPIAGLRFVQAYDPSEAKRPSRAEWLSSAECPDPWLGQEGPRPLRLSNDQVPRRTVYFLPDGLSGEAIDLRQLQRQPHPSLARPAGFPGSSGFPGSGLQAAGGRP
jgi:hypothetical protein